MIPKTTKTKQWSSKDFWLQTWKLQKHNEVVYIIKTTNNFRVTKAPDSYETLYIVDTYKEAYNKAIHCLNQMILGYID